MHTKQFTFALGYTHKYSFLAIFTKNLVIYLFVSLKDGGFLKKRLILKARTCRQWSNLIFTFMRRDVKQGKKKTNHFASILNVSISFKHFSGYVTDTDYH